MRILGVDPGLGITGYGLVDAKTPQDIRLIEAGVIRTPSKLAIAERLKKIYNNLENIINEHHPDVLVLEKIYSHYKHPTTAILMGHARGVICLLCGRMDVRLVNYSATRIKKAVAGKGHATKTQVQRMVCDAVKLKQPPEPVDVTDALALALGFVQIDMKEKVLAL